MVAVHFGSMTNEDHVPTLIAMNAIHPDRMAEISRWPPTALAHTICR